MIAHKYYGDVNMHWTILVANDIIDYYEDWPMSTQKFEEFVKNKYDNPQAIHHYEIAQTSGDTSETIEVYNNSALYTGDTDFYVNATIITNREFEEREIDVF